MKCFKVIPKLIKNLKKKTPENKIDKTKVDRDFVLDKPNLVEKLIEDIYNGDCSKFGSKGKKIKIAIENYEMEIDNVRITTTRFSDEIYYNVYILFSLETYFMMYEKFLRKSNIFFKTKISELNNVYSPVFTNKNCEQYKVRLNKLTPYVNRPRYEWLEIGCCELSFTYHP